MRNLLRDLPAFALAAAFLAVPAGARAFCLLAGCSDEARHAAIGQEDFDKAMSLCDDHRVPRFTTTRPPKPVPPGWTPPAPVDWAEGWQEPCAAVLKKWEASEAATVPAISPIEQQKLDLEAAKAAEAEKAAADLEFVRGQGK